MGEGGATTGRSLIESLLDDHKKVEALLERFDDLPQDGREEAFRELTEILVQHEVAEEETLYPAVRALVPGGDELAGRRIEEQVAAEGVLIRMEDLLPNEVEFMQLFANLRDAVLEHAKAEEATVFPELAQAADSEALAELGGRYERAKAAAPTHPHPHVPHVPPGNMALGTVAAVVDRIRDAMHKAS